MSEAERQDVIDRLKVYADRLKSLMDFLGDKSHLSREEKAQAQELMKTLKEALEADYRKGASVRGREQMNEWEAAYFHGAVHEAYCEIGARWNSDPIQSRWHGELYAAHIQIMHRLRQLEDPQEQPA